MPGEAMLSERLWTIGSGACMIVAATALLWKWNVEVAFVAATLGAVCWFLSLRNHLKKTIVNEVEEKEDSGEENEEQ